jgi:hypothetical protein
MGRAIAKVKVSNYSFPTRGDPPALLPSTRMQTLLERPKRVTTIVAETGDITAIARRRPRSATADEHSDPLEPRPISVPASRTVARC